MDSTGRCSTAVTSFLRFHRLLGGSGVARLYDDGIMVVNWDYVPEIVPVLDRKHPDFDRAVYPDGTPVMERHTARRVFGDKAHWFSVSDGRQGWARAVELVERMAYERACRGDYLVLDFSGVRPRADPLGEVPEPPACGPVPFMRAFMEIHAVKGTGMEPWEQTLRVDHALAACAALDGAGGAPPVALKSYDEPGILDFIEIHRQLRTGTPSVAVGGDFWREALDHPKGYEREVLSAVLRARSGPRSFEPDFVTLETPGRKRAGAAKHVGTAFSTGSGSDGEYEVDERTRSGLLAHTRRAARRLRYEVLIDPSGEMVLFVALSPPRGARGDEADGRRPSEMLEHTWIRKPEEVAPWVGEETSTRNSWGSWRPATSTPFWTGITTKTP